MSKVSTDVERISRIPGVAKMLEVICKTTGMGFAAIARVTGHQWLACAVRDEISFGLKPGEELVLETTLCNEIRQHHQPIVIDDVGQSTEYASHHTPRLYGLQSYISVPIFLLSGEFYGTLCAIDPKPAELSSSKIQSMFELFADLLSQHLGAMDELEATKEALSDERSLAELREQFIAILAHDIRIPVSVLLNGTQLLLEKDLSPEAGRLVKLMEKSAGRIRALVDNMMDLASSRLGKGITVTPETVILEPVLTQVVQEFQSLHPQRDIRVDFSLEGAVTVDAKRLAQALSNLLANALKYGHPDRPVIVEAHADESVLRLVVSNEGEPIPVDIQPNLFKPFVRGEAHINKQGLGLGLYITAEIAKAHGGRVEVRSDETATVFTLYI